MRRAAALALASLGIAGAADPWCAPAALAVSSDGRWLYAACASAGRVDVIDAAAARPVRSIRVPGRPSGLALSPDGSRLYVTSAAAAGKVAVLDTASGRTLAAIPAGHTAHSPVLSRDGELLYVCNRLSDDISVIDVAQARELGRVKVVREPEGAALTADGKFLLVANGLPAGRADTESVASEVTVIDTARRNAVRQIRLPRGSTGARGIRISPDGGTAVVTHLLARYQLPTTQADRGWIETNAVSLIDVAAQELTGTALLDEIDRGAANPWAVDWSADGRLLAVTHAGTHEVSLIDAAQLRAKLENSGVAASVDMSFLLGLRKRVALNGNGPRALALAGSRAWVAGYFSDTVEAFNLDGVIPAAGPVVALSKAPMTELRRGEMLFNDGSICFQGWQSCASCHGPEARVDGLNWDLLNDGIGNPKNAKSLLASHRTPPAMSQHVREDAEAAVRAGIRHILFAERPEQDALAIDAWLKSLGPAPSPHRTQANAAAARRGRKLFHDRQVGCSKCHSPGLFTDLTAYDVGTRAATDTVSEFDTPTLIESWRTAPYLHDGSAATLRDVLTTANKGDRHGKTSRLSPTQIDDLLAYLLTL